MTDPAPAVTGRPLRWLRLDGLVLLASALVLFAATHQPWWLVPAAGYGLKYDASFQHAHLGGPRPRQPGGAR